MKALIFNSGIGKRMGELTKNAPKSMVKLKNGETIFERQIRLLSRCGIQEFIITTGPFEEQLIAITKQKCYAHLTFHFVHNDRYDQTNYIYSCYLARDLLRDDDFLMLHGDLVFSQRLVKAMLRHDSPSLGLIHPHLPLPEKDFKGRVQNGKLKEVGISIFDSDCYAFQPLYKLSQEDMNIWLDAIVDFVEQKKITQVYAENALNMVSDQMHIQTMSYERYYINEIDNMEDYEKVSQEILAIDTHDQPIYPSFTALSSLIKAHHMQHPFIVMDSFLKNSKQQKKLAKYHGVFFYDFKPNPLYEDVLEAMHLYQKEHCDGIISIGGGSAIDTAKAVRLFLSMPETQNHLESTPQYRNIPHIAIPTTAGTGSESTSFAVIYEKGEKQSLSSPMLLPEAVILDERFLLSLPLSQKKATLFDALCQSIESMWSVQSTKTSQYYALKAMHSILTYMDEYFSSEHPRHLKEIFKAANDAGKAINISKTTAAHAMSYKVTSLYHIPHGHAVALCMPGVWNLLLQKKEETNDPRGKIHIARILKKISYCFGCENAKQAQQRFCSLLKRYDMERQIEATAEEMETLITSVNPLRLKNFPIDVSRDDIEKIYATFITKKD